jgi:nucleoside-diphosphate-sugar epimerase
MILVTGGTGFIGKSLVRHLVEIGKPVRLLLRPSAQSPNLPKSVSVQVAVCSLRDERGLRAAMRDVDLIIHLAGGERLGSRSDLEGVDVDGTRTIAKVAAETGVKRLVYLSHLGANRASAYPVLKAKGISESYIQQSGVEFTILRTAPVYGPGDQFTTSLAKLCRIAPGFILVPGKGDSLLQPVWVGDLVVCLGLAMDNPDFANQLVSLGGSETFRFREVVEMVMDACGYRRHIYSLGPAYLRYVALWSESLYPSFPLSLFWLDYLSVDRTCSLDILPRQFGLIPARFGQMLDYLKEKDSSK